MIAMIASSLSVSIRHLQIQYGLDIRGVDAWLTALHSPQFAPHLESIEVEGDYCYDAWEGRLIEPLATTVMAATGEIRPIRRLQSFMNDEQLPLLASFHHLDTVHLIGLRGSIHFPLLRYRCCRPSERTL